MYAVAPFLLLVRGTPGMISQTVEYSLRAMVALAYRHRRAVTVQEIARLSRAPAPFLSKLMQMLAKAQLVQSRRGQGGGFTLAREPHEITIWDIVQAVDPIQRIERCPLDVENHTNLCPLHRRLDQALAGVEEAFRSTSLAQLIAETGTDSPFCPAEGPPLLALSTAAVGTSGGQNKRKKTQRKRTSRRK